MFCKAVTKIFFTVFVCEFVPQGGCKMTKAVVNVNNKVSKTGVQIFYGKNG